jgi:hypothetical protein
LPGSVLRCVVQEVINKKERLYLETFVDFTSGRAIAIICIAIRKIVRAIYFFLLVVIASNTPWISLSIAHVSQLSLFEHVKLEGHFVVCFFDVLLA